jgi:DNA polymerase III subunit epsilon
MNAAWDQVRSWWDGRGADPDADRAPQRWIVVDVETSGLDAHRDRLLAIAALGLSVDPARGQMEIVPADSFEVVLRQDAVSARDNILLHGIGEQRQRDGMDPALALQAFADFAGTCPLLAFHSAFDQTLIDRHVRQVLGRRMPNRWLDVADLCAVTHDAVRARTLDDWIGHFGIPCLARHQASADTLATAELMLRIWPRVVPQGMRWEDLERLAGHRRWLADA